MTQLVTLISNHVMVKLKKENHSRSKKLYSKRLQWAIHFNFHFLIQMLSASRCRAAALHALVGMNWEWMNESVNE